MAVQEIQLRQHRALAHAIDHCARLEAQQRPRRRPPSEWSKLEKRLYLEGRKRFGGALRDRLRLEFPRAFVVHDSSVWRALDPELKDFGLRLHVHDKCRVGVHQLDTIALLTELADGSRQLIGEQLDSAGVLVCATRLALKMERPALAIDLAVRLARVLLTLGCCPIRAAAAYELWEHSDSHVVAGLKRYGRFLRFGEDTWQLFAERVFSLRVKLLREAYRYPEANELPEQFMPEFLREMIDAFATSDHERTESYLRTYPLIVGLLEYWLDANDVSLWRPSPSQQDLGVVPWKHVTLDRTRFVRSARAP